MKWYKASTILLKAIEESDKHHTKDPDQAYVTVSTSTKQEVNSGIKAGTINLQFSSPQESCAGRHKLTLWQPSK